MRSTSDIRIEETKPQDLDEIISIEQVSFPTPWPRQVFDMEIKSAKSFTRLSRLNGKILGYIVAWKIYDEVHILNVAVHPDYRRLGIASGLILDCISYYSNKGAMIAVLEVRSKNETAIRLYEKLGFTAIGLRRGYYNDTGDDAIIMKLNLDCLEKSVGF